MGKGLWEQPEATEEGEQAGSRGRRGQGTGSQREGSQQADTQVPSSVGQIPVTSSAQMGHPRTKSLEQGPRAWRPPEAAETSHAIHHPHLPQFPSSTQGWLSSEGWGGNACLGA